MKYLRRVWRAAFCRPPMYLDGMAIKLSMTVRGLSWDEALRERGNHNVARLLAWHEGERC